MQITQKRLLSWLLAVSLVLGYIPVPGHAAEVGGLCEHHTDHTADCGYIEGAHECSFLCEECAAVSPVTESEPSEDPAAVSVLEDADGDGYYEIATADDLYAFAEMVNGGQTAINGKLTADIVVNQNVLNKDGTLNGTPSREWTPIGNFFDVRYAGTFDGDGHTISGLYFNNSDVKYVGLFGSVQKPGTVKNVGILDSYFCGYNFVGGIAGNLLYGTVDSCYNAVTVIGNWSIGGVVGENNGGTVSKCHNTGAVSGGEYVGGVTGQSTGYENNSYNTGTVRGNTYVGGVAGYSIHTMSNCYNTGTVTGSTTYVGGVVGYSGPTVSNCYYLTGTADSGIGEGDGEATAKSETEFASGEVAYLLQGEQEEQIWGQTLGTDNFPVLGGVKVYKNGDFYSDTCMHVSYKRGMCAGCGLACAHETYENGLCTVCGGYEAAELVDGVYQLGSANQLYWFAELVNGGETNANAILTADIVVNENVLKEDGTLNGTPSREWTPIGNYDVQYDGTFDGDGHTISGLYFNNSDVEHVGLFGCVGGNGTVKNVCILDSYFCGYNFVGGVAGGNNYGTVSNCYNTGTVSGNSYVGGVVGQNAGLVINCYNTGVVIGIRSVGGVVGYVFIGSTVSNCYNTGTVSGNEYVGGVVGYVFRGSTVSNCYNTGNISGPNYTCGVVGYNDWGTVSNCYYLTGTADSGIAEGEGEAAAKSEAEFASGEVAYLLQGEQEEQIWGQTIGTEVYPVLGGEAVYYGYASCGTEEMGYTNIPSTEERPDHAGPYTVDFEWPETMSEYDSVDIVFLCICGKEMDSTDASINNGHVTLDAFVEGTDCQNPGSATYTATAEYNGQSFTDTVTYSVPSENHIDLDAYGFCACGGFQEAVWNADASVYEIGNAGQLYWFASYVNNVDNGVKAVLTADIIVPETAPNWVPIGEAGYRPYSGHFNGQNHTISGLKCITHGSYAGLFGATGYNYEIKNIGVIDSYFEGANYVGGLIGSAESYISNCYVLNTTIKSDGYAVGGLVGYNYSEIVNAYTDGDSIVGTGYGSYENCYFLSEEETEEGGKTAAQFASGEVAYLLQSGVKGEEVYDDETDEYITLEPAHVWGQTIGTDAYPMLGGAVVYKNDDTYTNICQHPSYEDGVCIICGIDSAPVIITQPTHATAYYGETYKTEVVAEGYGLTYQWYIKNAGASKWSKSSVTDSVYTDVMTKARNDRQIYCLITDEWGHSVKTNVVRLVAITDTELKIVSQPSNGLAAYGEEYCSEVIAEGDGLTYQWYIKHAGSSKWYKSKVTDSTYNDIMTEARNGRQIYCVITDVWGNTVKTETVRLAAITGAELKIVSQPGNALAAYGEEYCSEVIAEGDGLIYQWYIKNVGDSKWSKSKVTDSTYNDIMTEARNGRLIYCVITDIWGNTVQTDTVRLVALTGTELKIVSQPTDAEACYGDKYRTEVVAEGDGLTYQWYIKNANSSKWSKSSVTDSVYTDVMTEARNGRQIYCVVTDIHGNTVKSDIVRLIAVTDAVELP